MGTQVYKNIDWHSLCYLISLFNYHGFLFQASYYNTNIRADRLWTNLVRTTYPRRAANTASPY